LILTVLEPDFDLEYFDYQLAAIAKKITAVDQIISEQSDNIPFVKSSRNFFDPSEFDQLNSRISELKPEGGSIWWSEGSDLRSANIHFYNSMLPATAFAAYLRDPYMFGEFDFAWDHARNLHTTQSDNASVDFGGKGDGFIYHAIAHQGRSQIANTGYAAAIPNPLNPNIASGVILSDGQFGLQKSAMVSRIICKMLPTFLSTANSAALNPKSLERLIAFLQHKLPQAQQIKSLNPFGFCLAYVIGNSEADPDQPIAVHVVSSDDYVCLHIRDNTLAVVFENQITAEGPTVLYKDSTFFKSTTVYVSSGDRLFIGYGMTNISDLAGILANFASDPSPQRSTKTIFQNTIIAGQSGNISLSVIDF
jgi:hypothetical protein